MRPQTWAADLQRGSRQRGHGLIPDALPPRLNPAAGACGPTHGVRETGELITPHVFYEREKDGTRPGVARRCRRDAAPSPTTSPSDPMPAGPRTAGRPHTRHLARKLSGPRMGRRPGGHIHHRVTTPLPTLRVRYTCAAKRPPGRPPLRGVGFCRGNAPRGMLALTRGRPRHRGSLPRDPGHASRGACGRRSHDLPLTLRALA